MDIIQTVVGLLLIAASLTLVWSGERTWLVAAAQGLGMQAVVGFCAALVQVGFLNEGAGALPVWQRIRGAVEGTAFHAGGWTGEALCRHFHPGADPAADPGAYLPVFAVQGGILALFGGSRLMKQEGMFDLGVLCVTVFAITNAVIQLT